MFTWICPKCGREVPPSYNECPDCTAQLAAATPVAAPPDPAESLKDTRTLWQSPLDPDAPPPPLRQTFRPAPEPPPPPAAVQPAPPAPPAYEPAHAQSALFATPEPTPPPRQRGGQNLPTWVLAVLFAVAFLGLGLGVFTLATRSKTAAREVAASTNVDSPAAKPGAKVNALQKYIEISGVRFSQDKGAKTINVSFVLVNHSDTDVDRLTGNVTVWGRTRNSEEDAVGTFSFMTSIPAEQSKELVLPFNTKLKFIELPDWQNVTVDVQITGPATY